MIARMNDSITSAAKVLRGEEEDKERALDTYSLSWNEVLQSWRKIWDGSLGENVSTFAYIDMVLQKFKYLQLQCQKISRLTKSASTRAVLLEEGGISLSNFFNPKSFVIAMKQQAARAQNCSIHDLVLHSSWGSDPQKSLDNLGADVSRIFSVDSDPEGLSGLPLRGIMVQGAQIGISGTAARLHDVSEGDDIVNKAPAVAIGFVQASKTLGLGGLRDHVQVPLYEDTNRTSIIDYLRVPCDKRKADDDQQWSIKAIAFFTSSSS